MSLVGSSPEYQPCVSSSWVISLISPSVAKHVHFGPVHQFGSYYLNSIKIDSVESQKDLGILFDHQLKFHLHTTDVVAKANRLATGVDQKIFQLSRSRYVGKIICYCCLSYFGILQFGMGAIIYP